MTTRPWMPLYVAEYLADTAHLGALESGAYLHLIFYYWQTGALPSENKELARIAKVSSHSWKKLCPILRKFFHDGWRHKRIDQELAKVCEISEKRRNAVNSRKDRQATSEPTNVEQKKTHSHSHSHIQREEEKKDLVALSAPSKKVLRRTNRTIPDDWKPNEQHGQLARSLGVDVADTEQRFRDYCASTGRLYADHDAAFRNFIKNAPKFNGGPNGHRGSRPLQDDEKSISRAAGRLAELAERGEFSFGPRPSLLPENDAPPVQLLSKG